MINYTANYEVIKYNIYIGFVKWEWIASDGSLYCLISNVRYVLRSVCVDFKIRSNLTCTDLKENRKIDKLIGLKLESDGCQTQISPLPNTCKIIKPLILAVY